MRAGASVAPANCGAARPLAEPPNIRQAKSPIAKGSRHRITLRILTLKGTERRVAGDISLALLNAG